jgi:hypothetical protein
MREAIGVKPRTHLEREHLARAARRLASIGLRVDMGRVRIVHAPWLFRLPGFRRFHGYEIGPLIFIRRPLGDVSNDLITHELTHVWQDQNRRVRMWLSYLVQGYRDNEHEVQAREAAASTRDVR